MQVRRSHAAKLGGGGGGEGEAGTLVWNFPNQDLRRVSDLQPTDSDVLRANIYWSQAFLVREQGLIWERGGGGGGAIRAKAPFEKKYCD